MNPDFSNVKTVWLGRENTTRVLTRENQRVSFSDRGAKFSNKWTQSNVENMAATALSYRVLEYFEDDLKDVSEVTWAYEGQLHRATRERGTENFFHVSTGRYYSPEDIRYLSKIKGVSEVRYIQYPELYDLFLYLGFEKANLGTYTDMSMADDKINALTELGLTYSWVKRE